MLRAYLELLSFALNHLERGPPDAAMREQVRHWVKQ